MNIYVNFTPKRAAVSPTTKAARKLLETQQVVSRESVDALGNAANIISTAMKHYQTKGMEVKSVKEGGRVVGYKLGKIEI